MADETLTPAEIDDALAMTERLNMPWARRALRQLQAQAAELDDLRHRLKAASDFTLGGPLPPKLTEAVGKAAAGAAGETQRQRDAAAHNEREIRKHLACRIEAADRNAVERDAARDLAARLAEVGARLWADRDAAQGDQAACRRLFNAWRDLGPALADARTAGLAGEGVTRAD